MSSDSNKVQGLGQGDRFIVDDPLQQKLDDTVVWLRFREHLAATRTLVGQLERVWPERTVPRQAEVAELTQRLRNVQAYATQLLEALLRSGNSLGRLAERGRALGVEIPERRVRGVTFDCEECGQRKGSHLDDGWYRCNNCGYPGK